MQAAARMVLSIVLALLLMLVALIVRGVAFEYRSKHPDAAWRKAWDYAIIGGSAVPYAMIERFWRPLFAGIQLDPDLDVSARRFLLILRMLATGDAVVPARGMGAIPEQLAAALPEGAVELGVRVDALRGTTVRTVDGSSIEAEAVVIATDGPAAARLLDLPDPGSRAAACVWFSAPAPPAGIGRHIALDGGVVGHIETAARSSGQKRPTWCTAKRPQQRLLPVGFTPN